MGSRVGPPGWPAQLPPPETTAGWREDAHAWLLDQCPPEWRHAPAFARHPEVLAYLAVRHAHAQLDAAREAWRNVPAWCAELNLLEAGEVRALLEREGTRLRSWAASVELVADALRGQRWVPRL